MNDKEIRILAIDDEAPMLRIIAKTLVPAGYEVRTASNGKEAIETLHRLRPDIVITDLMMPDVDGFRVTRETLALDPEALVIVITAYSSVETAVQAMQTGAYDFVSKPFDPEHLLLVVRRAAEARRLRRENRDLREELGERDRLDDLVGASPSLQTVKELVRKVRSADGNVLITGESGTGKELVARAIHYGSRRRNGPFLPLNCGALPDTLLESELFGYEKGAFSGAADQKRGLFEMADGGTVFLDEIGSVSELMQIKLLRFLEDRSFIRLGGSESIPVDLRIVAATNEDPRQAVEAGAFRKDLYYRLNVIPIVVPPLRDRPEDIPLLTRHFIRRFSQMQNKPPPEIAPDTERCLAAHRWDGNVRELQNVIERAVTLANGPVLSPGDLPDEIRCPEAGNRVATPSSYGADLPLAEVERRHIRRVLDETEGNKSRAAKILGIDYSTLLRKLKADTDPG